MPPLLTFGIINVRIKCKVELSSERRSTLPYISVVAIEKEALDYGRQLYLLIYSTVSIIYR